MARLLSVWTLVGVAVFLSSLSPIRTVAGAHLPQHQGLDKRQAVHNNYSCVSATHPNPVVLLHGLGATYYEDLNELEADLQQLGFCTFSLTYGTYPQWPYVGGLVPINESAAQVAAFIQNVYSVTGAGKIDIVGHSEGAFLSLYIPKFEAGIASMVDKLVAIAPPTHGTSFAGLAAILPVFGNLGVSTQEQILNFGCPACDDLTTNGAAVAALNSGGPIVQPGNTLTVIASEFDELVTPTATAFVEEDGVSNIYIQQGCPMDPVGHVGEAYDTNVWNLVLNALNSTPNRAFSCSYGSPGRL